jgi:hypothetical protein
MTVFVLIYSFFSLFKAQIGKLSRYKVSNIPVIVTSDKNYTSAAPTWLTSSYFRAGNEAVISTFTGSSVPSTTYTFTFSSALPGIPSLAYGIKNYRGMRQVIQETITLGKNSTR